MFYIHKKVSKNSIEFLLFCLKNPMNSFEYVLEKCFSPVKKQEDIIGRLKQLHLLSEIILKSFLKRWEN